MGMHVSLIKKKKNSNTGLTDALASEHPMLGGSSDALSVYLSGCKQKSNQQSL